MAKAGSESRKKGHYFEDEWIVEVSSKPKYGSEKVDRPSVYCESIGKKSRDKVDTSSFSEYHQTLSMNSLKCPSDLKPFQMSSFANDRQLAYFEAKVGYVPKVLPFFIDSYFGHTCTDRWIAANEYFGIDTSTLNPAPKTELPRQRTFASRIPEDAKAMVVEYFENPAVKLAFTDMHLISGFTDTPADYQIYHPAKTKDEIDATWHTDNFYVVDLAVLRRECLNWHLDIGESTSWFGPINWKIRGGGGESTTPTKGSYHNAQTFSGVEVMSQALVNSPQGFYKGTLPEILEYMHNPVLRANRIAS